MKYSTNIASRASLVFFWNMEYFGIFQQSRKMRLFSNISGLQAAKTSIVQSFIEALCENFLFTLFTLATAFVLYSLSMTSLLIYGNTALKNGSLSIN